MSVKTKIAIILMMGFMAISSAAYAQQQAPCTGPNCPQPSPTFVPINPSLSPSGRQLTPQQIEAGQRMLTPAQQAAIQQELGKTGGVLTPQAKEALKARPEFQGLSPEDILKGKEILEKRERESDRKDLSKETIDIEKKIIGEDRKSKSLFDRTRLSGKYQDILTELTPFGYDFFREAAVRVVTERRDIPVPLKYVVGPGDEVKILLWGRVNGQYNLVVDRDGKITVPQIGPLPVAGMTFEQMSAFLIKQTEQIVGTNIDVTMGSLRTIPIFVLGDVSRPGAYMIGASATITDALLLAGGPTEIGSMRNVQVKRKDKVITTFDLYDLLLKGDKSKDVVLQAGDVVFVPVTGPLVGIAGNVRRPAVYELKDKFDLQSLLDLAGGIIPTAYTQQIQIERIMKSERQVIVDINDKHLDKAQQFKVQDADLVKVFSIVERDMNVVYLNGNLRRPGKYEYRPGLRIKDLIKDFSELLPETYLDYALIKRLKPPSYEPEVYPFNLGKMLVQGDAANNVELAPQDQVYIFNKWFFADKPYVTVEGEIRGALSETDDVSAKDMTDIQDELKTLGKFDILEKLQAMENELRQTRNLSIKELRDIQDDLKKLGRPDLADKLKSYEKKYSQATDVNLSEKMRVKDAILTAGGLTRNAYLEKAEIIRISERKEYTTIYFNLAKAMGNDPAENILLKDRDRIIIHSIWEQVYKKTVSIDGQISKPGRYQFTQGMTVRDILFKAGNVLESAYLDNAEITSMIVDSKDGIKFVHRNVNLTKALEGDPAHNVFLSPYDSVLVKKIPEWREAKFVSLGGEIRFPGRYALKKGERLSSLLERAGGYTDKAYLRGAYFTRERVRELQQKSIEEMAVRLERQLLSEGAAMVSKIGVSGRACLKAGGTGPETEIHRVAQDCQGDRPDDNQNGPSAAAQGQRIRHCPRRRGHPGHSRGEQRGECGRIGHVDREFHLQHEAGLSGLHRNDRRLHILCG